MLNKLGNVLKKTTDRIANAIFLDKNLLDSIIKDLQRALIEADVNIHLVKKLSDKIKIEAQNERIKGIEKKEHLIKILYDELTGILGEKKELLLHPEKQDRIMFLGLYGSGKTTTSAKLANYFGKRGKKTAIVGLDVHRPAAKEQLLQLGKQHNIKIFTDLNEKNPINIWKKYENEIEDYDLVIIDTAGRDALDSELIDEIKNLEKLTKPTETILVIPADIGQTAKKQAEEFKKAVGISGVIITRMDSSAKGGGALTACAETKAPVYFITTGEKINDIEYFNPESFLSRLLGMGDLEALVEKIRSVSESGKKHEEMQKRLEEGKITLTDVIEQVKSMNEIGGFSKIKEMIPGFSKAKVSDETLEQQNQKIKNWEHIIRSMTKKEIENPEIIEKQTSRISRIAKGAGVNNSDVRSLLKQYSLLKSLIKDSSSIDPSKGLSQKHIQKLAKKLGKKKLKL
jgi:signal recognition particle subunit SRP54